jgi:serine/threonine protein phosphatase PrpC
MAAIAESRRNFRCVCSHDEMNPKRRSTMEDCHRIIESLGGDSNLSYFGVYDGHGGRKIVDFLEEALENNIIEELRQPDDADIPERLARAFLITDMQSRKADITTSGATAVSALIKYDPSTGEKILYVANVGDSRAVLARRELNTEGEGNDLIAERLSFDHRAEDDEEQKRITDAGGFIIRARVLGILAVTRSFGDHGMKDFVTANPYISTTVMKSSQEMPMLILACDGVWDVFTDQEAVTFLNSQINEKQEDGNIITETEAANLLVQASIERGSADNITVIVVYF